MANTVGKWNDALHPRDRKGRFIEKNGLVQLPDGSVGNAYGAHPGPAGTTLVDVERADGSRVRVPSRQVSVTSAPATNTPPGAPGTRNAPTSTAPGASGPLSASGRPLAVGDRITAGGRTGTVTAVRVGAGRNGADFVVYDSPETGRSHTAATGRVQHIDAPAADASPEPSITEQHQPPAPAANPAAPANVPGTPTPALAPTPIGRPLPLRDADFAREVEYAGEVVEMDGEDSGFTVANGRITVHDKAKTISNLEAQRSIHEDNAADSYTPADERRRHRALDRRFASLIEQVRGLSDKPVPTSAPASSTDAPVASNGRPLNVGDVITANGRTGTITSVRTGTGIVIFRDEEGRNRSARFNRVAHADGLPADASTAPTAPTTATSTPASVRPQPGDQVMFWGDHTGIVLRDDNGYATVTDTTDGKNRVIPTRHLSPVQNVEDIPVGSGPGEGIVAGQHVTGRTGPDADGDPVTGTVTIESGGLAIVQPDGGGAAVLVRTDALTRTGVTPSTGPTVPTPAIIPPRSSPAQRVDDATRVANTPPPVEEPPLTMDGDPIEVGSHVEWNNAATVGTVSEIRNQRDVRGRFRPMIVVDLAGPGGGQTVVSADRVRTTIDPATPPPVPVREERPSTPSASALGTTAGSKDPETWAAWGPRAQEIAAADGPDLAKIVRDNRELPVNGNDMRQIARQFTKMYNGGPEGTVGNAGHRIDISESYVTGRKIILAGNIRDKDGNSVGTINRTINFNADGFPTEVHNDYLRLDHEAQGQGIARDVYRRQENYFIQQGVPKITIHANIDVGGYAWASAGYDYQTAVEARDHVAYMARRARGMFGPDDNVTKELAKLQRWMAANPTKFPTPWEVSRIGYTPGATTWPGKELMLGSSWMAVRKMVPGGSTKPDDAPGGQTPRV